jgi:ubiquinone/menaquinone biosynthesis C-methylase UbiE
MLPGSETMKIRDRVLKYCIGKGVDFGARHDKIHPSALGVDRDDVFDIDVVMDVSDSLPFKDQEFGYVFSSHCLEHIQNTEITLKEWVRVLRIGGYIILYLPHKDLYKGNNPDHKHDFVNKDITILLEKLGIKILENYIHQYSFLIVGMKE